MKFNGVTLELYNQDDADRFRRFVVVLDCFGVFNHVGAVSDRFVSIVAALFSIIAAPFSIVSAPLSIVLAAFPIELDNS